jgi:hypothetical protein
MGHGSWVTGSYGLSGYLMGFGRFSLYSSAGLEAFRLLDVLLGVMRYENVHERDCQVS